MPTPRLPRQRRVEILVKAALLVTSDRNPPVFGKYQGCFSENTKAAQSQQLSLHLSRYLNPDLQQTSLLVIDSQPAIIRACCNRSLSLSRID
jgi:hypothetical protein